MQDQMVELVASQAATAAIVAANAANIRQLATQVAAIIHNESEQDSKINTLTTTVTAVASAVQALAISQEQASHENRRVHNRQDQRDVELRLLVDELGQRAIEAESRERRRQRWSDLVATRPGAAARNDTPFYIYGQKRVGGVHHAGQDFVIGPNELYADNIMYHGIHYEFWWYVEPDQAGDPPSWRNGGYISSKSVLIFTGTETGEVTMTKN